MLCLLSISWDFRRIPRPRLGLLVPAVSLTYFAISKSPARRQREMYLFGFVKVFDESWFFSFVWWFLFIFNLQLNQVFCGFQIFGSAHLMQPPNVVPGHLVGTWLVWHLCGVQMAMILHLSWWYGQFFQRGWHLIWNSNPYDWIPMGVMGVMGV